MHLGLRHQFLRRRSLLSSLRLRPKRLLRTADILAYTASTLSLLFTTDQIRIIWFEHSAKDVSLLSWIFYTTSALVWLFYGYVHHDRVLITTNFLWVLFSMLIVGGIVLYR